MTGAVRHAGPASLMQILQPYIGFARNGFLNMLAYRMRYYTGFVNYLTFVAVNYFIWQAVFAQSPSGAEINGFTLDEMVTYVTVAWIARTLYHTNIDYTLNTMVESGNVVTMLLRPIRFQFALLSETVGEGIFRAFFLTIPVSLVLLLLFPVSAPASFIHGVWFFIFTFFSYLILSQINFITGLSAFYLHSIMGVIRAKFYIVQLCSGLLLPIPFFPGWMQSILAVLPFQYIAYVPLQVYLGKIPPEDFLKLLSVFTAWTVLLLILGSYLWSKAAERVTVQGG